MTKLAAKLQTMRNHRDRGATMVEYGLIIVVVALVAVIGAALLGTRLNTLFGTDITNKI